MTPAIMLKSVLLPAPFGPITALIWPRATATDNASGMEALLGGVWMSPEAVGPWVVRVRSRGGSVADLRLSVNVVTA